MLIKETECDEFTDNDSERPDDATCLLRMTVDEYIKFKADQLES